VSDAVALSEVLGALSYALDLTEGEPPGHAVRTTAIGMRLAEQIGMGEEERSSRRSSPRSPRGSPTTAWCWPTTAGSTAWPRRSPA
jgi:hypothetical protein